MATVLHPDTRLAEAPAGEGLSALEREMVAVFADIGQALGLPKSYGEIYGLLYASAEPLSFAEIETRLELSKGSVSQGLKALREIGAVRRMEDPPSPGLRRAGGGLRTEDGGRTERASAEMDTTQVWPGAKAKGDSQRAPLGRERHNFNTEGAESTEDGGPAFAGPTAGRRNTQDGGRGRDYFAPETELRQLVAAILREGIAPRLQANAERLAGMPALLKGVTLTPAERKLLSGRIEKLQGWRRKASGLLPWMTKFLG